VRQDGTLVGMTDLELADRVERVLAATAGDIVNPAVAALMTAAALTSGDPGLAIWAVPAGAAAGALTSEGALLVRRAWSHRSARVDRFAQAAAGEAGITVEELASVGAASDESRRLLGVTVQAATAANDEWKIRTLARAFVRGAADPARVDEMVMLVDLVRKLDVADVRLMATIAVPDEGRTFAEIISTDPGLDRVAVPVLRKLKRLEFADTGYEPGESGPMGGEITPGRTVHYLTPLGRYCADRLSELGSLPHPDDH